MSREYGARLHSRWDRTTSGLIHARVCTSAVLADMPAVVFVHGLVISSLYMIPTAVRLAPFFPVFAPDLPGFGRSQKPVRALRICELADALAEWLDVLGLERAVLVGNSLGCQITCDMVSRHQTPILAAVLAGPTMDRHARTAPQQIGRWLADWTRERPSLAAAHARDYYQAGLHRAYKTFRYALQDRVEETLPHLLAPTLVVRGSEDRIVPQRWAEEVTALLPRGRLQVIAGGPHVVNYTSADAFAHVVRNFIQDVCATPAA
jgi:2-hydroxy-6-oxonona-2,4-dienedioate hydrolase